MRVTISTGGVWHAFQIAEQLHQRGILKEIITGYPAFKLGKWKRSVPWNKIRSISQPSLFSTIVRKLPLPELVSHEVSYGSSLAFDLLASLKITGCDVFIGWPTFCLRSMKKAESKGIITVIDADHLSRKPSRMMGKSDIKFNRVDSKPLVYQKQILDEEYKRYCNKPHIVSEKTVVREWKEYDQANYLLVPTQYVFDTFLAEGVPENKLIKIPYGVSPEEFGNPRVKGNRTFRILFGGSISIRKGIQYLLKAYNELRLPNSELLLFGGIESEVKPILKNYTGIYTYKGYIRRKKLSNLYKSSSVFVLPSVLEGFGLVILEAMSCGLPVITTTHTGGVELIRDGIDGFVIPIRDTEALKKKILYLYEHEKAREEMGHHAFERAKEFTWERYSKRLIQAFKKIIGARSRHH